MNPKVSIITRTKDRPIFLARALKSVGEQSFNNYEHIIINDGGDISNCTKLIDSLDSSQKQKTKLIHRPTSSNAPDTIFNESIDASSAEYVVIHDDDDTWHADFLKLTLEVLDSNKNSGGVVSRTQKIIEEINIVTGEINIKKHIPWQHHVKEISLYRQCAENQLTPISFVFRRSAYEKVGKFDSTLPVIGDWDFGIRLLKEYDVDFIDPGFALANYHHREYRANQNDNNTSFAGNDKHRYYSNLIRNKYLREELREGRLGVGYIMSKIRYEENYTYRLIQSMLPKNLANWLKKRAS